MKTPSYEVEIYCSAFSDPTVLSRVTYVCEFIEARCSEIQFVLQHNMTDLSGDVVVIYDKFPTYENLFIPFTGNITMNKPYYQYRGSGENAVLFPDEYRGFDIFAAIFHTILRTEEYESEELDTHGRFRYQASWQYRASCIDLPIVDIWIDRFLRKLKAENDFPLRYHAKLQPTFDIDYAWKYRHLTTSRYLKKWLKSILTFDGDSLAYLISGMKKDPYDTFDKIMERLENHNLVGIFFLLLSGKSRMDIHNRIRTNSAYSVLLQELLKRNKLGLHPSYYSSEREVIMREEIGLYTEITGETPKYSRQHFLRIKYPDTVKLLDRSGVEHDYTMGYAGREGWRSGTSYPYPWYDMETEKTLGILVHPLQFMDVTMTTYQGKTPEETRAILLRMGDLVKRYGGEYTILWHNSFFSGKSDIWWEIFDESLQQ